MPRHANSLKRFEGNRVKDAEKAVNGVEGSKREVKADMNQMMKPIPTSPAGRSVKMPKGC